MPLKLLTITNYENTFIYFLGTLTCLMSLLLSACSEDDATGAPYLKISKEELVFGKHEGEALLYIQSNAAYEVTSDAADWCSVVQQVSTSEKQLNIWYMSQKIRIQKIEQL